MKKKNGFLAVSIIFSFFIVFLMILTLNMTSYAQNRILLNQIKKDIKSVTNLKIDKIDIPYSCNPNIENCPICKRATNLHNIGVETYTTYGNIRALGSDIESGDAFDCDVNGDGEFNEETERFYYLSDLYTETTDGIDYFDSDVAVLIYYKNVASNIRYNSDGVASHGGPSTIKNNLPTDWTNVSLSNSVRDIRDNTGNVMYPSFNYVNTRIPTYQELAKNCKIYDSVNINVCTFLTENSERYWLETPTSDDGYAYVVFPTRTDIGAYGLYASYGVRPVIEVNKDRIEY